MMVDMHASRHCRHRILDRRRSDWSLAGILGGLCENTGLYRNSGGHALVPRSNHDRAGGPIHCAVSGRLPEAELRLYTGLRQYRHQSDRHSGGYRLYGYFPDQ